MVLVLLASVLTLAASVAHADVFNMPSGETSLSFVTVADAGNAADTTLGVGSSGYGSVPYVYRMGEYDVTVGQYVQFLNAVAKTDTYGLYFSPMGKDYPTIGITQSGSSGNYSYSVTGSYGQGVNCPIFDVTWGDAARFCNWLQNGQPTGPEGNGTTETGAYTLNGAVANAGLMAISRNNGATYFIPSENEWYKVAYYNPSTCTYWTYPTRSNADPSNVLSSSGTNNANYLVGNWPNGTYTDPTNYLTPVGAFVASPGPYGTYDMGGDLFQWNEASIGGSSRGLRGGGWEYNSGTLASSNRDISGPTVESLNIGFRVASLPTGWHDPGDANGDGQVDINDLTIVLTNFGQPWCAWSQGCMDGDPLGIADINDLTIVLANFGTTYGPGLAAVPEPSALVLLAAGVVSLVACTRRQRR
jgi:formylglycine-generating enzyme required for sulfatase activity